MKCYSCLLVSASLVSGLWSSVAPLQAQIIFAGDGSDEPGFVAPIKANAPPPPPAKPTDSLTVLLEDRGRR